MKELKVGIFMSVDSLITLDGLELLATMVATKLSSMAKVVTEKHTLTAKEVEQKYFELEHSVVSGHESEVLLFVGGVVQVSDVDFVANGTRISWSEKGLDEIGLIAGDICVVQYKS